MPKVSFFKDSECCPKILDYTPGKDAKLDHRIQLNCGEMHTHGSYKTIRTWQSFNNQGTKTILLSDEL